MASLNFGKTVTLKQAAKLVGTVKNNRFMLQGEPGIGKSSLMTALAAMYPDYHLAYIDVPNMDLGDICMPVIDHETKTTKYYPNARFGIHKGKPSIIMLTSSVRVAHRLSTCCIHYSKHTTHDSATCHCIQIASYS
jgi:hypothetical protein